MFLFLEELQWNFNDHFISVLVLNMFKNDQHTVARLSDVNGHYSSFEKL